MSRKQSERQTKSEKKETDVISRFIFHVQRQPEPGPLERNQQGIFQLRARYLSVYENFKKTKEWTNFSGKDENLELKFTWLHDAIFSTDLIALIPRYRGFFAKERHTPWSANGQRGWDGITNMEKRRIDFLFDVNRELLDRGSSFLKRLKEITELVHISQEDAHALAQQLELELITEARPERGYFQDFLEFYLKGPDTYEPTLPLKRDLNTDAAGTGGGSSRRMAAPGADAEIKAALRRRMFDSEGKARVLHDAEHLIKDPGETIRIRSLGQGNGIGPFYHEGEYGDELSCGAHATGSLLTRSLDIDAEPLALTTKKYDAEVALAQEEFQGGPLGGLAVNDPDFIAAVLRRLNAKHRPITFELLHRLTPMRQLDPIRRGQSGRPESLPTAQVEQIRNYFRLIGLPTQGLQFFKEALWTDSPDWPFLKEMIDGQATSLDRMEVCYTANVVYGVGHFVAIHRDKISRKWVLVDSTKYDQPGLRRDDSEFIPSDYLAKYVGGVRADAFEVIFPEAPEHTHDEEAPHNGFFSYYNDVLATIWFSDATDALSAFAGHNVSKILLDEHRRKRPEGHDDERDGPVFDYTNLRMERPDVYTLGEFLDTSARLPSAPQMSEVTDIDTIIWNDLSQFMEKLNELREREHVDRIILSGWETAPFFVAAEYRAGEGEDDSQWRVLHGNYEDQTLEAFFPQLIASLPVTASLGTVDVLYLQSPYNTALHQAGMGERVKQWSTERMDWMVKSVQNSEEQIQNRIKAQQQEEEQERIRAAEAEAANAYTPDGFDFTGADADVYSLFNESMHTPGDLLSDLHLPPRESALNPGFNAAIYGGAGDLLNLGDVPGAQRLHDALNPSLFRRRNLANLITGQDLESISYTPKIGRSIDHARTARQDVEPSRLAFAKGRMLQFLMRPDVELMDLDEDVAAVILERFREEAETDPRYARLQDPEHLKEALSTYVEYVRHGHLPYNPHNEFNSQVMLIRVKTGDPFIDLTTGNPQESYITMPLLVQMKAEKVSEAQKYVKITGMLPATQPNLYSMILSRGKRQWQFRELELDDETARVALDRLREDCLNRTNGAPPEELLEEVDDPKEFFEKKIQESLRRRDNEAPEVMTPRLWRVTIQLGEFDVRLLLTKRQNRLQSIDLATRENLILILEQVDNADARRIGLIAQLNDSPDDILERFRRYLNSPDEELRGLRALNNSAVNPLFGYTDALAAIEKQNDLGLLDDLGGDYAPLKQLLIETRAGDRLNILALFEEGVLVALREDEDEDSDQVRRDMLRFNIDAELAEELKDLLKDPDSDDDSDVEELDAAANELREMLDDIAPFAGELPDAELLRISEGQDARDGILRVIQNGVRRGTGQTVHPDYPDLKRYEFALTDASGEIVTAFPVLVRLKDLDSPEEEDRIREFRPDTALSRKLMLEYQLHKKDLDKILSHDNKQDWEGTGHGPLRELAEREYRRLHQDDEDIDFDKLPDPRRDFIQKIVRRNAPHAIPVPGFPDIARYPTGFLDRAGNMIYLVARVSDSQIRAVRLDIPQEFMNMALHLGDPGNHLQSVFELIPDLSVNDLQAILQPAHEDREPIPPDYVAYSLFNYSRIDWEGVLQEFQFVARLEGNQITKLTPADRFDELAQYTVPVTFMSPIRAFDVRNGKFVQRHLNPRTGQTFWEFVYTNVVRANKLPVPDYPQLGRYPVQTADGNNLEVIARVESGDIQLVGGDDPNDPDYPDRPVLRKMEKEIRRDWRLELRRAESRYERNLRFYRQLDQTIDRIQTRQRELRNPDAVKLMVAQANDLILQKAAKRDARAETIRQNLPDEIRPRQSDNMTALFDDENLLASLTDFFNEDGWEQVANHTGEDIRRKTNGSLDEESNPLYIYAYMRGARLRDIRVGNEDTFELQVRQRREEMEDLHKEMLGISGMGTSHLPLNVVHGIWSVDRYVGRGMLMAMADRAQKTFPQWLRSLISQPHIENGRPVFKDGIPVLDRNGRPVEWLRRYPTGVVINDQPLYLIGEFQEDPLDDTRRQIILVDAYVEPPEDNAGYLLSPPLRALWDYLATGAKAPVGLPVGFDAEAVGTPLPRRRGSEASSDSGLFVRESRNNNQQRPTDASVSDNDFMMNPDAGLFDLGDIENGMTGINDFDNFDWGPMEGVGLGWLDEQFDEQEQQQQIATAMQQDQPTTMQGDAVSSHEEQQLPQFDDQAGADSESSPLPHAQTILHDLENAPLEQAPFIGPDEWDAIFNDMNLEVPTFEDAGVFPAHPSFSLFGPEEQIRESVDEMLAEFGINRPAPAPAPAPGAKSASTGDSHTVYALHRIEYDNPEVIERLLADLHNTHGKESHKQFLRAISPNGDPRHLEDRFSYLISQVAQPDREREVSLKHPYLKTFSLGLRGGQGETINILAPVINNLVGRPWIDNPKNEKDLIKKLEADLDEKKIVIKDEPNPKTALSEKVANIFASQLKISNAQLFRLYRSLSAQALGSEVLHQIDVEERKNNPRLANAKKMEVFRSFLTRGLREALMQPRSNARLLTIPTSVRDMDEKPVQIKATVQGNGLGELWLASTAKRQHRKRVDLIQQELVWNELIGKIPYNRTRKVVIRQQKDLLEASMKAPPRPRKSVTFSETPLVMGDTAAAESHVESETNNDVSDMQSVVSSIATGTSNQSLKRRINEQGDALSGLHIDDQDLPKRRRLSQASNVPTAQEHPRELQEISEEEESQRDDDVMLINQPAQEKSSEVTERARSTSPMNIDDDAAEASGVPVRFDNQMELDESRPASEPDKEKSEDSEEEGPVIPGRRDIGRRIRIQDDESESSELSEQEAGPFSRPNDEDMLMSSSARSVIGKPNQPPQETQVMPASEAEANPANPINDAINIGRIARSAAPVPPPQRVREAPPVWNPGPSDGGVNIPENANLELVRIADLNKHLGDIAISKMLGMGPSFINIHARSKDRPHIKNSVSSDINLTVNNLADRGLVVFEDEVPFNKETDAGKLRWPSRDYKFLPHPVKVNYQPATGDVPAEMLVWLLRANNVSPAALEKLILKANKKNFAAVLSGRNRLGAGLAKRLTDQINDWPAEKLKKGLTRWNYPEAKDDELFVWEKFERIQETDIHQEKHKKDLPAGGMLLHFKKEKILNERNRSPNAYRENFLKIIELNLSIPDADLSALMNLHKSYVYRFMRDGLSITNKAAHSINAALAAIEKNGPVRYEDGTPSLGNMDDKQALQLPYRGYRILPTPMDYQAFDIEAADIPRQTFLDIARRSNLSITELGDLVMGINSELRPVMLGKEEITSLIVDKFMIGIEALRKKEGNKVRKGRREDDLDAAEDVVFLPENFDRDIFSSVPKKLGNLIDDLAPANRQLSISALTQIADLNHGHLSDRTTSTMLGLAYDFISKRRRTKKTAGIDNVSASTINLAVTQWADAQMVIFEDEVTFNPETDKKKLRWPSRNFKILPDAVELNHQIADENAAGQMLLKLARYNNLSLQALELLILKVKGTRINRVIAGTRELSKGLKQELAEKIKNWPEADLRTGLTRMDEPQALENVLFVWKEWEDALTQTKTPNEIRNENEKKHTSDPSRARFLEIISLNGSISDERLSTMLNLNLGYIYEFFKNRGLPITNNTAYLINTAIADFEEKGSVIYEDGSAPRGDTASKATLRLPSPGYKVPPTPLKYDHYPISSNDILRRMFLDVARRSNLSIGELEKSANIGAEALRSVMRGHAKVSAPFVERFITAIEALPEGRVRSGRARMEEPKSRENVIFLPDRFKETLRQAALDTFSEPAAFSRFQSNSSMLGPVGRGNSSAARAVPKQIRPTPATVIASGQQIYRSKRDARNLNEKVRSTTPDRASLLEIISLNASMSDEELSKRLGLDFLYVTKFLKEKDIRISNDDAFKINRAFIEHEENGPVEYADASPALRKEGDNVSLRLPSPGYRIRPTPLNYEKFSIDSSDIPRRRILDIAKRSNLSIVELERIATSLRGELMVIMQGKAELTSAVMDNFLQGLQALSEEPGDKVRYGRRENYPIAAGDVVFLPEGFLQPDAESTAAEAEAGRDERSTSPMDVDTDLPFASSAQRVPEARHSDDGSAQPDDTVPVRRETQSDNVEDSSSSDDEPLIQRLSRPQITGAKSFVETASRTVARNTSSVKQTENDSHATSEASVSSQKDLPMIFVSSSPLSALEGSPSSEALPTPREFNKLLLRRRSTSGGSQLRRGSSASVEGVTEQTGAERSRGIRTMQLSRALATATAVQDSDDSEDNGPVRRNRSAASRYRRVVEEESELSTHEAGSILEESEDGEDSEEISASSEYNDNEDIGYEDESSDDDVIPLRPENATSPVAAAPRHQRPLQKGSDTRRDGPRSFPASEPSKGQTDNVKQASGKNKMLSRYDQKSDQEIISEFLPEIWEAAQARAIQPGLPEGVTRPSQAEKYYLIAIGAPQPLRLSITLRRKEKTAKAFAIAIRMMAEEKQIQDDAKFISQLPPGVWAEAEQLMRKGEKVDGVFSLTQKSNGLLTYRAKVGTKIVGNFVIKVGRNSDKAAALAIAARNAAKVAHGPEDEYARMIADLPDGLWEKAKAKAREKLPTGVTFVQRANENQHDHYLVRQYGKGGERKRFLVKEGYDDATVKALAIAYKWQNDPEKRKQHPYADVIAELPDGMLEKAKVEAKKDGPIGGIGVITSYGKTVYRARWSENGVSRERKFKVDDDCDDLEAKALAIAVRWNGKG